MYCNPTMKFSINFENLLTFYGAGDIIKAYHLFPNLQKERFIIMNDIRLNKEQEKEIVRAKFKIPPLIIILLVVFIVGAMFCFHSYGEFAYAIGITALIFVLPFFISWIIGIKKSSCVITNKRIYGVTSIFIIRKKI